MTSPKCTDRNRRDAADASDITPQTLPFVELTQREISGLLSADDTSDVQDIYPLAPLQEGILFHHLLQGVGDVYLLRSVIEFDSHDRLAAFLAALQKVIDRHDALRSSVHWENLKQPLQVVHRQSRVPVIESIPRGDRSALAQLLQESDPRRVRRDLRRAPLLAAFVTTDPTSGLSWLALLIHEFVCDPVSMAIILREINCVLQGDEKRLPPPMPYRDFIVQLRTSPTSDHEWYFRERLADIDEPTAPFGLLDVRGDASLQARVHLDEGLARDIRELASTRGIAPTVLFHVAYAEVLGRCTGREEVVFGTVLSGRSQGPKGIRHIVGLLINTLPIRLSCAARSVLQRLAEAQSRLTELELREHAPLTLALRCSAVPPSLPLYTAVLNVRHAYSVGPPPRLGEASLGIRALFTEELSHYPLTLVVDDELDLGFFVRAQSIPGIEPGRIVRYFETALQQLIAALRVDSTPSCRTIEVLPAAERHQLLQQFNDTAVRYPEQECLIHELIEKQVCRTPEAVAVVFEGQALSYRELNCRANQVAHRLLRLGVRPDDRVAIYVERSLEMVVGLLGILKAGAAYVPLDSGYPTERVRYMLRDSAPVALITHGSLLDRKCTQGLSIPTLVLNQLAASSAADNQTDQNPNSLTVGLNSRHLAYVIYTSGSTGEPKGVMNEHRGVMNRLLWAQATWQLDANARVLHKTPLSFDVSVWEIFWPLMAGARLSMARPGGHQDPEYLAQIIERESITMAHFVPSMLQLFLADLDVKRCRSLRQVVCSGEALPASLQRRFIEALPHVSLHNLYGPTEAAIDVTWWDCSTAPQREPVPIGYPIANTQIYILDSRDRLVPIGVSGEIHIGGAGVARGYLNRAELTTLRFVKDPFRVDGHGRLYKTGDIGRYVADGAIEYLGRNDHQVKIRGFRIELGEIEAQLARCAGVREAAVVAHEDKSGDKRLIGYAVADEGVNVTAAQARSVLQAALPEHMVPATLLFLPALPLTPNGKLDRTALPGPNVSAAMRDAYEAPKGPHEQAMAQIWKELLRTERVGRHDNFFELGGHSLLASQLVSRLRRRFGADIALRGLFAHPTLEAFTAAVREWDPGEASVLVPIRPGGTALPLFLVHALQGEVGYVSQLAPFLPPELPIYALVAKGTSGNEVPFRTIEAMAALYVHEISRVQPDGAYRLAGWSTGGTIVYEMTSQLLEAHKTVAFVGLIEPTPRCQTRMPGLTEKPNVPTTYAEVLLHTLRTQTREHARVQLEASARAGDVQAMIAIARSNGIIPVDMADQFVWRYLQVARAHLEAESQYIYKPLPTVVTLFSADYADGTGPSADWRALLGDRLRIIPVGGTHESIVEHPHIEKLGCAIASILGALPA